MPARTSADPRSWLRATVFGSCAIGIGDWDWHHRRSAVRNAQHRYHLHLQSAPTVSTQHNTTQHITTHHNTTQHNTTQHNTTQHNTTHHNTHHNTTQHNTTQHNTTQQTMLSICCLYDISSSATDLCHFVVARNWRNEFTSLIFGLDPIFTFRT
jgi:hypothetical protein